MAHAGRCGAGIAHVGSACAANSSGITTSCGSALFGGLACLSALTVAFAVACAAALAVALIVAFAYASTAAFISIPAYTSASSQHHPTRTADVHPFSVGLL